MSTDQKTVYKGFGYLGCDDFAGYLEAMAAKGWHLERWGAGLHFRKGEPEAATYAVEVFTDASEYDTRPEAHTREFAEYCEAAGWHLVDAKQKFVIFKKIRPDAVPIMTDAERLENVAAEEQKKTLRNLGLSGAWAAMRWFAFFGYGFIRDIFIPQNLMILMGWTALFLASLVSFVHLQIWKIRSRKRIRDGFKLCLGRSGSFLGFRNWTYTGMLMIVFPLWLSGLVWMGEWGLLVAILACYTVLLIMSWLIDKFRPDAVTNEIIQVLVSAVLVIGVVVVGMGVFFGAPKQTVDPEEVPLWQEDLSGDAGALKNIDTEYRSSIFGSMRYFGLFYEKGPVVYYIYESDHSWVLDKIWKEETDASNWEDCTDLWGTEQAVCRFGDTYVVRCSDRIVSFNGIYGEELTPEQMGIIRNALCD